MDDLRDVLDDLDRLYQDRTLDVRHRDRFQRRVETLWPQLADAMRALVGLGLGAGTVSHLGDFETCATVLAACLQDFRHSNAAAVSVHLLRHGSAMDYRLSVRRTGRTD